MDGKKKAWRYIAKQCRKRRQERWIRMCSGRVSLDVRSLNFLENKEAIKVKVVEGITCGPDQNKAT